MNLNETLSEIDQYSNDKYLEYTMSVIVDRALPYLQDGLKPVHRRILYSMTEMGIKAGGGHKKSARIIGDVLGKYHPHGDTAVYDAMVRMSQKWVMRYPLIDGQGNFGSREGDGAAAMRYTESSLTPFADHILLSEIKYGTSDFKPNYDGTMEEVRFLSSRLNNLLLNGSIGIAVGMSTDIPSHNIREVTDATIAYIDNMNISIEEIMEHIKGPDFASAAQITNTKEDILNIYKTGNGKIYVRARWKVEKLARGQWQIVITELPPNVDIIKVLKKIDKISNPPVVLDKKGKPKKISAKAQQDKIFINSILSKCKNDSNAASGDRLVIEPKSSRQDPEEFMKSLIPMLELENTFKVNMISIGQNGRPSLKNIKDIIAEWVEYRLQCIKRRENFHLNKIQKRIHILEGRLKVYNDIDKAISIIKESESPKEELMEIFSLSERQAEDILEIKLRQLAKLEKNKLEEELSKLLKEEDRLIKLLSSDRRLYTLMKKEIESDTQMFEDKRRTLIKEENKISSREIEKIVNEDITVIYTNDGWITQRKGHSIDTSTISLKQGDEIYSILETTSVEPIVFLASNGRGYSLLSKDIPNGKNSVHINSLLDLGGSSIIDMCIGKDDDKRLFTNSNGFGFISSTSNLISKNKAGKAFMTIQDECIIFKPLSLINGKERVNVFTTDNRLLSFNISEMKELNKGKGIQLIKIVKNNQVSSISTSKMDEIEYILNEETKTFNNEDISTYEGKRASRGRLIKGNFKLI